MPINGKLFNYENGLNGNMSIYVAVQEHKKLMQLNLPPTPTTTNEKIKLNTARIIS